METLKVKVLADRGLLECLRKKLKRPNREFGTPCGWWREVELILEPYYPTFSNSNFYVLPKEHGMELDYNQVGKVGDWKSLFVGIHGL